MKRCPSCRRVYDRDSEVCQADGATLADFNMDPVVMNPVVMASTVGQTIAKRYRVVRKLGGGPLGTVYLGKELATGNNIALKIFVKELQCDDEALKQCRWDARFATASQPSRIVRVFEVNRTDEGQVFIAMEYLEGESLADIIRREGALELGRALRLTSQIAQGLIAASKAGVPHRDLKLQNVVVVGADERVKVTDFGIARLWRTTMSGTRARLDSVTLEYTAPERLIGGDADDRTDVYGLGAMLYAMLTGAAPPTGASRGTGGNEKLGRAPRPVRELRPEVPLALEQALLRSIEREPERRQSGMQEFAENLLNLVATVIEPETRQAATPAVRESALEPSPLAPHAMMFPASAPETDQSPRGSSLPCPKSQERWQAQWRAYRVRFQAYRERRQAERLAYRAQLEAQRQAGRVQRQAARLAYHAQREAQRHAAREQRHARRLQWQAQWRAYRAQFQSYRARRQARWLAYRTQLEAQRQVSREQRQARRERWQTQWRAYRASLQSYRESLQTGLRERWWSRLERARSSLGESTGRLTALASRSLGNGLRWGHANGGRLAVTGVAALVVVGAMAWAAPNRRAEAPASVQSTARDSGIVGDPSASRDEPDAMRDEPGAMRDKPGAIGDEPGAIGTESAIVPAPPPRRAGIESSGVADRSPSPPMPAGEGPNPPRKIPVTRHQQPSASPRLIVPPAEIESVAAMEPESLRPPPPSSVRSE